MTSNQYVSNNKIKEHIISFIVGAVIAYIVFLLIAVMKDAASWKQIIIPSLLVGIATSIWKDKFVNIFLEIAKWF
jgi:hypothetical protein